MSGKRVFKMIWEALFLNFQNFILLNSVVVKIVALKSLLRTWVNSLSTTRVILLSRPIYQCTFVSRLQLVLRIRRVVPTSMDFAVPNASTFLSRNSSNTFTLMYLGIVRVPTNKRASHASLPFFQNLIDVSLCCIDSHGPFSLRLGRSLDQQNFKKDGSHGKWSLALPRVALCAMVSG
jgi:hypothetical protein